MLPPDQSLLAAVQSLLQTVHPDIFTESSPLRLEDDRDARQRPMWVLSADAGTDRHPQLKSLILRIEHRVTDEANLLAAGAQARTVFETLQSTAHFCSLRATMAADQCLLQFFRPTAPTSAPEGERGRCFSIEVLTEVWSVPQG